MELDLHGQIKKRKGWQKVILLTIQGYFDNKVGRNAAAMTYYLLFAMFPFFIFVTSLLGLLHLPTLTLDGQITRFLPEDVVAFLNLAIEHITKSSNNALLTFGLVFSVWFPLRAVSNLMEAINDIYGEEKSGSHSIRTAILTALTIVLIPAMLLLLLLGERVLGFVGEYIPISTEFITGWSRMRFVPMAAALLFVLSAVYFFLAVQNTESPVYPAGGHPLHGCVDALFPDIFLLCRPYGTVFHHLWLHRGHHCPLGVDGLEHDRYAYGRGV